MQISWTVYVSLPALAFAILGWPTGRPSRTIQWWILGIAASSLGVSLVINLFGRPPKSNGWPGDPLAPFSVAWVAPVWGSIEAWLLYFVPSLVVIVLFIRRRRGLPRGARRLLTPITVAGILVFGSDLVTVVINSFAKNLTWDDAQHHGSALGALLITQNYAQVGVAAVGLLVAFAYRQRAVRVGARRLDLDLGTGLSWSDPSTALQRLLDDSSARVLYPHADQRWVDADGLVAEMGIAHRILTPVEDDKGTVAAAIETDAYVGAHPSLIEIGAATVAAQLVNQRATAMAKARLAELTSLQSALLDATDLARRRLEQDLHDGAQQRLVGVTLAARLAARNRNPSDIEMVRAEVVATRTAMTDLLEGRIPVVLSGGLAGALATLAATCPLDVDLKIRGDLEAHDPLSRAAWFIASEATANAIKHAVASKLRVELGVEPLRATLRIADNGRGGLALPPRTIAARAGQVGGAITLSSPAGNGTDLVVHFDRTTTAVAV
jgi:signal transduction histidine kinase